MAAETDAVAPANKATKLEMSNARRFICSLLPATLRCLERASGESRTGPPQPRGLRPAVVAEVSHPPQGKSRLQIRVSPQDLPAPLPCPLSGSRAAGEGVSAVCSGRGVGGWGAASGVKPEASVADGADVGFASGVVWSEGAWEGVAAGTGAASLRNVHGGRLSSVRGRDGCAEQRVVPVRLDQSNLAAVAGLRGEGKIRAVFRPRGQPRHPRRGEPADPVQSVPSGLVAPGGGP
jgi:hypothetical protein